MTVKYKQRERERKSKRVGEEKREKEWKDEAQKEGTERRKQR